MIDKANIQDIDIKREGKVTIIRIQSPSDKQAKQLVEQLIETMVVKEDSK